MSRNNVILTGLIGLIGAVLVTALCLAVMRWAWLPVLVTNSLFGWAIFLFLLIFSVSEIPVMIVGMRRIAASANPKARYLALLLNCGYVFFGAVYAVPYILLTGGLALGALLASLSLVRFISSLIYLSK
ncbi:MAG: hypothetical protein HC875_15890 [Anaerolineales bacterium]|nr:hypothetical protein [Anaerolineales bacterium]